MILEYLQFQKQLKINTISCLICLLSLIFLCDKNNSLWAAPSDAIASDHILEIQQDHYQADGVLVTRPNVIDTQIHRLIRCNNLYSIENYLTWLDQHVQYQKDIEDSWSNPVELLRTQRGDCEDYALLNATVTRILGYPSHILAIIQPNTNKNHAICSFFKNGHYYWIDNKSLKKTTAGTLEEFSHCILKEFKSSYLFEYRIETQTWALLSSNSL